MDKNLLLLMMSLGLLLIIIGSMCLYTLSNKYHIYSTFTDDYSKESYGFPKETLGIWGGGGISGVWIGSLLLSHGLIRCRD